MIKLSILERKLAKQRAEFERVCAELHRLRQAIWQAQDAWRVANMIQPDFYKELPEPSRFETLVVAADELVALRTLRATVLGIKL